MFSWRNIQRAEVVIWVAGVGYYLAFLWSPTKFSSRDFANDPMPVMLFGVLLVALVITRAVQNTFFDRVRSLLATGAIHDTSPEPMEEWFRRRTTNVFWVVFLTLYPLYAVGIWLDDSDPLGRVHLFVGGGMGVALVSLRFAHGIVTGWAVSHLCRRENQLVLNPMAQDRAGGMGRLGYYYFNQAALLLLPAFFMVGGLHFLR